MVSWKLEGSRYHKRSHRQSSSLPVEIRSREGLRFSSVRCLTVKKIKFIYLKTLASGLIPSAGNLVALTRPFSSNCTVVDSARDDGTVDRTLVAGVAIEEGLD